MPGDLSNGFCKFILDGGGRGLTPQDPDAALSADGQSPRGGPLMGSQHHYQHPRAQVIDVQKTTLPRTSTDEDDDHVAPSTAQKKKVSAVDASTWHEMLYVCLSDSASLVWAVAPPGTGIAALLQSQQIESGSVITLNDYSVIESKGNGRNVVVLLQVLADTQKISLIGKPDFDKDLFPLSPNALRAPVPGTPGSGARSRASSVASHGAGGRGLHDAAQPPLAHLWANPHDWIETPWAVTGRVLWKSKLRRVVRSGLAGGSGGGGGDDAGADPSQAGGTLGTQGSATGGGGQEKFVFDAKLVDAAGDGAPLVFWGPRRLYDQFDVGDVVMLGRGTIKLTPLQQQQHPSNVAASAIEHLQQQEPLALVFNHRCAFENNGPEGVAMVRRVIPIGSSTLGAADADGTATADGGGQAGDEWVPVPLPATVFRELCAVESQFANVALAVHNANIGDTVNVRGLVVGIGGAVLSHTRRGPVQRRSVTLADPGDTAPQAARAVVGGGGGGANNHNTLPAGAPSTVQLTLWGSIAVEGGAGTGLPALGTRWCFRNLVVRMYGTAKVLSSKAGTELYPQPSAVVGAGASERALTQHVRSFGATASQRPPNNAHGGDGGGTLGGLPDSGLLAAGAVTAGSMLPPSGVAGDSLLPRADSAVAFGALGPPNLHTAPPVAPAAQRHHGPPVLQRPTYHRALHATPPGGQVIARVSGVTWPVVEAVCAGCSRRAGGTVICGQCGATGVRPRYCLHVTLSDGVGICAATCAPSVGDALFGITAAEFCFTGAPQQQQQQQQLLARGAQLIPQTADTASPLARAVVANAVGQPVLVRLTTVGQDVHVPSLEAVPYGEVVSQLAPFAVPGAFPLDML